MAGEHAPGGMFGGAQKPASAEGQQSVSSISQQVSNMTARLRVLEERYTNSRRKTQLIEENMLSNQKKFAEEMRLVHSEIDDFKHTIREVEERIIMVIKEIRMMAKKEDVDTMRKYLELWEPVNFVTQGQVERITKEIVEEMLEKEKGK